MTNKKKKSTVPGGVGAYMNQIARIILISLVTLVMASAAFGSDVTGDPAADGWISAGISLEQGIYVRGTANYGFELFTTTFIVQGGSNTEIADGEHSWLAGDTILGAGGRFLVPFAPGDPDWEITGTPVNSLLSATHGPKLIAKFGTADATWSASANPPVPGDGSGSTSDGGNGTVFVRTSGWFHATDPLESQDTDTTWSENSGEVMPLDKPNHISRTGFSTPDDRVARVVWIYEAGLSKPASWQLLLNVSLLDRLQPSSDPTPSAGDPVIISVQDRDSAFTDALAEVATSSPMLSCVGFKPPLDQNVVVRRPNRVLPLRMTLEDADGFEVFDITPPVVSIAYSGNYLYAEGELDVLDSAGQSDDGNQFEFKGQFWAFNLSTKGLAPGTYTITAVSGNLEQYVIDPTCTVVVEIE